MGRCCWVLALQCAMVFSAAAAVGSNATINLLWPGSSWASIACGTQYQLFVSQGFTVRHIMGASGGAASAVMMLADPNPASLTVLRDTYQKYSEKCDFDTGLMINPASQLFFMI